MKKSILYISLFSLIFFSCNNQQVENKKENKQKDKTKLSVYKFPERTKKSNIYEVNIRQYTPEGTIKAFEKHLPRLKKMGIDILWLMPIFPISEKNRKGSLGSYYAVANDKKVNPEFGTEEDLHHLIETAHKDSMLVILDWVANHTGWDNPWITEHPDWYTHDSTEQIISPVPDWTDVADLNYDNQDMRNEMVNSMKFWLTDFDVDGFRCDVAMMVPTDFWDSARIELDKVKPVFMLSEAEQPDLMKTAFDMNYAWNFHHIMNDIAKNKQNADSLRKYFENDPKTYPSKVYRMAFTSNHDENSWNGTVYERMPHSYKTFAVLTFVAPGMPLIYSGQEAGLNKRLKFFDKDTIDWSNLEMQKFYTKLIKLKNENKALWNGKAGSPAYFINTSNPEQILTFNRIKDDNRILVIMNLSDHIAKFHFIKKDFERTYKDYFTEKEVKIKPQENYTLKPWEFQILFEKK